MGTGVLHCDRAGSHCGQAIAHQWCCCVAAAPVETELKLLAPSGALDQLRTSPAILQSARNKGTVRRLETTYYDTNDHHLFDAGLSLRVRRSGRHLTQTIKSFSVNGALTRAEWEAPVKTLAPDLSVANRRDFRGFQSDCCPRTRADLVTRVRRHAIVVDVPDGRIEVAFDEGVIEAGVQREPVPEIELELKQGKAAALYQFGLGLMDVSQLRLGAQSKSDPAAVKAGPSNLRGDDSVVEEIAKLLSACQQQILSNLYPAASGREPEGVHQLRVALRRLHTAFYCLRREMDAPSLQALDAEAKRFARTLGPARLPTSRRPISRISSSPPCATPALPCGIEPIRKCVKALPMGEPTAFCCLWDSRSSRGAGATTAPSVR
ncbi:inorganic triphosphatase [Phyllobacterium sophorae]|uniref:CYTH domain-containing protein n=1 Tax=Phyllobacterium sophorae TaxID=1520277 RepID=A0A2P7B533_9HYPH|nr:hypothetical protein CU103_22425 [Phyllobacterium sophorae]